jgi:hypothetical protein
MGKFENTYIDTFGFALKHVNALAKKYANATGYPLSPLDDNNTSRWRYLASVKTVYDRKYDPTHLIAFTDDLANLVSNNLTKITEKDLDAYIKKTKAGTPAELFPSFDFKIDLSHMTEAEKMATRDWLMQVLKHRGIKHAHNFDVSNFLYVSEQNLPDSLIFNECTLPELKLSLQTVIDSWTCTNSEIS